MSIVDARLLHHGCETPQRLCLAVVDTGGHGGGGGWTQGKRKAGVSIKRPARRCCNHKRGRAEQSTPAAPGASKRRGAEEQGTTVPSMSRSAVTRTGMDTAIVGRVSALFAPPAVAAAPVLEIDRY